MLELSFEGVEFTTYSIYISLLLTASISVLIWLIVDTPFIGSWPKKGQYELSTSESFYLNKAELNIDQKILILKKIRMKIAITDDEKAVHFSPNKKIKLEEKNEITFKNSINHYFANTFSRLPSCRG